VADEVLPRSPSLNELRLRVVCDLVVSSGATRVLDLGCGEGKLLSLLADEPQVEKVIGVDVSHRVLEAAARRLGLDERRAQDRPGPRVNLVLNDLAGPRSELSADLSGSSVDAAVGIEIIEHLDPDQLARFEENVFVHLGARLTVITTPNREYNVHLGLSPGAFRHRDHRFEWTREEFSVWAHGLATRFGYRLSFTGIGDHRPQTGPQTQVAMFRR
jgi:3' terminal RNA ribose 2'-O-methyltransferase Hen1